MLQPSRLMKIKPFARAKENQELDADITAVYFATKRRYGAPKIHQELFEQGWNVSLKRVQRRMSVLVIQSIVIKKEEIYRHVYKDSKEAYESIFEYIESWYNRQRTHSSLGYKAPAAVHAGGVA